MNTLWLDLGASFVYVFLLSLIDLYAALKKVSNLGLAAFTFSVFNRFK